MAKATRRASLAGCRPGADATARPLDQGWTGSWHSPLRWRCSRDRGGEPLALPSMGCRNPLPGPSRGRWSGVPTGESRDALRTRGVSAGLRRLSAQRRRVGRVGRRPGAVLDQWLGGGAPRGRVGAPPGPGGNQRWGGGAPPGPGARPRGRGWGPPPQPLSYPSCSPGAPRDSEGAALLPVFGVRLRVALPMGSEEVREAPHRAVPAEDGAQRAEGHLLPQRRVGRPRRVARWEGEARHASVLRPAHPGEPVGAV